LEHQPGLRDLKKRQTRDAIAAAADRLFAERGFDAVTVADVAREAQVAPKTVFNYFATKEDLFYSRSESFGREMLDAVRDRAAGETVLDAFRRFVLKPRGALALPDDATREAEHVAARLRVVLESPALLAREKQQVLEDYSRSLADLIAEETGAGPDDLEPRIAADALIAVHRALIDYARPRIVAGEPRADLRRAFRRQGRRAFARLEDGLGDYGRRGPTPSP
jgi:AcrR family transcriptional regulator